MKNLILACALFPFFLQGAHLEPWTGRDLEIIAQADLAVAHFKAGNLSNALFLDLSARTSYTHFAGELEANFAHSHKQTSLEGDALALTGRYQLRNDVIGDPFSLWIGATVRKVFTNGLHDPIQFYHGGIEGEFHVAAGKEWVCEKFWTHRLWGYGLIGIADLGSPWTKLGAAFEINRWDLSKWVFDLEGGLGFGGRKLHVKHFKGYGPLAYRYLQAGIKYAKSWKCGFITEVGLKYRPVAVHCPKHWVELRFALIYPFAGSIILAIAPAPAFISPK